MKKTIIISVGILLIVGICLACGVFCFDDFDSGFEGVAMTEKICEKEGGVWIKMEKTGEEGIDGNIAFYSCFCPDGKYIEEDHERSCLRNKISFDLANPASYKSCISDKDCKLVEGIHPCDNIEAINKSVPDEEWDILLEEKSNRDDKVLYNCRITELDSLNSKPICQEGLCAITEKNTEYAKEGEYCHAGSSLKINQCAVGLECINQETNEVATTWSSGLCKKKVECINLDINQCKNNNQCIQLGGEIEMWGVENDEAFNEWEFLSEKCVTRKSEFANCEYLVVTGNTSNPSIFDECRCIVEEIKGGRGNHLQLCPKN